MGCFFCLVSVIVVSLFAGITFIIFCILSVTFQYFIIFLVFLVFHVAVADYLSKCGIICLSFLRSNEMSGIDQEIRKSAMRLRERGKMNKYGDCIHLDV